METPKTSPGFRPEDLLILLAVFLLPWAFGGVEIWAYRGASLLIAAGTAALLWRRGLAGLGITRPDWIWLTPALLLAALAALQTLPLPPAVIAALSPEAHAIYSVTQPGYSSSDSGSTFQDLQQSALDRVPEAAGAPLPPGPVSALGVETPACMDRAYRTLSLQPSATQERLFWYLALLMAFLVVRSRVASPAIYRLYRWTLFGLLISLALFALVQAQSWNGKIYWLRPVTTSARAFGTFVNPTNLAGLMELGLPWMAGYAWLRLRLRGRDALREAHLAVTAVGTAVCLVAVIGSASKSGFALGVAGLIALAWIGVGSWRARGGVLVGVLVLAVVLPVALSATYLATRMQEYLARAATSDVGEGRLAVWRASLSMLGDFPLTGTGFGAFREVFPRYMPAGQSGWLDQAHNDYLELSTDGGLVAALLLVWLVAGFWLRSLRGGRPSLSRLGLAIGLACLFVHAMFDFNHQIPGVALVFVTAAAMLLPAPQREAGLVDEP